MIVLGNASSLLVSVLLWGDSYIEDSMSGQRHAYLKQVRV